MSSIKYSCGNIVFGVEGMDGVTGTLENIKCRSPSDVKNAINSTVSFARRLMIDKAKARYAINAAGARHLKDLKTVKRAKVTSLSAVLKISKMNNDLGYFNYRPKKSFTGADVLHHAPKTVAARVLYSNQLKALKGIDGKRSKGFTVEFKSGHIGMVQRLIGSDSKKTLTEKSGKPRWKSRTGKVEKLVTMGSPSAAAMHHTVWLSCEPEVEDYLQKKLEEYALRNMNQR